LLYFNLVEVRPVAMHASQYPVNTYMISHNFS
jgi:hypothetical protein